MSSKIYELKQGDDIRQIRITLSVEGDDYLYEPVSAKLILSKGDVRLERDLEQETDGKWCYRFEDSDFEVLVGSKGGMNYAMEVYATFLDGTNGTYPTIGTAQVKVYSCL